MVYIHCMINENGQSHRHFCILLQQNISYDIKFLPCLVNKKAFFFQIRRIPGPG